MAFDRDCIISDMISAGCAFQEGTTCEGRLDVLKLVVIGVLSGIETLITVLCPFPFIVATVLSQAHSHIMALRLTMELSVCMSSSLSETFFHDALEYFHFSGNFLYLLPEKVDLTDLPPECILVCFPERAQFVQKCFMRRQLRSESGHVRSKGSNEGFQRCRHVFEYRRRMDSNISANLSSLRRLVYNASVPPSYLQHSVPSP